MKYFFAGLALVVTLTLSATNFIAIKKMQVDLDNLVSSNGSHNEEISQNLSTSSTKNGQAYSNKNKTSDSTDNTVETTISEKEITYTENFAENRKSLNERIEQIESRLSSLNQ